MQYMHDKELHKVQINSLTVVCLMFCPSSFEIFTES